MKKYTPILTFILLAFTAALLNSCRDVNKYYDYPCKIVAYQEPTDWQNGKYSGVSREWLVQSLIDTNLYARLDVEDDSAWFNSSIGDTLYLEDIRKERFFKIHNKRALSSTTEEGLSRLFNIIRDTAIDSAFIYKGGIQIMYRKR